MRRARRLGGGPLLMSFVLLALASAATASPSSHFVLVGGIGDWLAVDVPIVNGQTPSVAVRAMVCSDGQNAPGTASGMAAYAIQDGVIVSSSLGLGGYRLGLANSPLQIGAAGTTLDPAPPLPPEDLCGSEGASFYATAPVQHSFRVVAMALAPRTHLFVNTSHPALAWTGTGTVLTKSQFDEGVHLNVHGGPQALSLGGGVRQLIATEGPSVGWFWPEFPGSAGLTSYSCLRSGSDCPQPPEPHLYQLQSTQPEEWDIRIDADARAGEPAHYVVGIIDLGAGPT